MTSVPRQLAIFAAVLAVLFTAGYGAGHLIDDDGSSHGGDGHAAEPAAGHGTAHNPDNEGHAAGLEAEEVRGLSARADGLRLTVPGAAFPPGALQPLRFQVLEDDGAPLTDYDVVHEKRMHLILVRRDLTGFQHLHPQLDASGTWETSARFAEPGAYRLFADFAHAGRQYTLGGDLLVEGDAVERELPAPADVARTGPYEVRLEADGDRLAFSVTRDGEAVDTDPYLGAAGHLVALRAGDLAFLHVHPEEDDLAFEAALPPDATYRLFLQFRHEGAVRTVAFTTET